MHRPKVTYRKSIKLDAQLNASIIDEDLYLEDVSPLIFKRLYNLGHSIFVFFIIFSLIQSS